MLAKALLSKRQKFLKLKKKHTDHYPVLEVFAEVILNQIILARKYLSVCMNWASRQKLGQILTKMCSNACLTLLEHMC